MDNERDKKVEDQIKDLNTLEVAELEDEDLEDVSGGNNNCGCIINPSFDQS
jgi:natural product precursor